LNSSGQSRLHKFLNTWFDFTESILRDRY
jgi:hypothetical protein